MLSVVGTHDADVINITSDGAETTVDINGSTQSFANDSFRKISVDAMGGNDEILVSESVRSATSLRGADGDDLIVGGAGNDILMPGAGNDTLQGGGGMNTAYFGDRSENITFDGYTVSYEGSDEADSLGDDIERFVSGSGDDTINVFRSGPRTTRFINAGAGDDTVDLIYAYGFANATVHGGEGNDDILIISRGATGYYFGGGGNDNFRVYRSSGTQRVFSGGAGTDTMDYSAFSNEYWSVTVTLDGIANDGSPTEYLTIGDGDGIPRDNVLGDVERIIGTPGADTLVGGGSSQTLLGMGGDDLLIGGGGNDRLDGGDGNDTLHGNAGDDTLIGGAGDDELDGGAGQNSLVDEVLTATEQPKRPPASRLRAR